MEFLVCPVCRIEERELALETESEDSGDVLEGRLACEGCGRTFLITNGVAFLDPAVRSPSASDKRYETSPVLSSYLWSHFGDILGHERATDAYAHWADLMVPLAGPAVDIGCAVGRLTFELAGKSDFAVGLDRSASFIRAARRLCRTGEFEFPLMEEGMISRKVRLTLPPAFRRDNVEFIVADALALPFRSGFFSSLAGLNLIDKLPEPLAHFREMNRVARTSGAQFLFSDPFSWSEDVAGRDKWLGGAGSGPFSGKGLANVASLLSGGASGLRPAWRVEGTGHVWWRIRTHSNHYEEIRSWYVRAVR